MKKRKATPVRHGVSDRRPVRRGVTDWLLANPNKTPVTTAQKQYLSKHQNPDAMKTSLFAFAFFIILLSCKKDDPLPAATQSGANTFGCKVNGKSWIPDGGGGFSGIKPVEGGYQGYYSSDPTRCNAYIRSRRTDKTNIQLFVRETCKEGAYALNSNIGTWDVQQRPLSYGLYIDADRNYYITDRNHTGMVNVIRADTANGIISGTFEFTAFSPATKKTITITDGRFDTNLKTQ